MKTRKEKAEIAIFSLLGLVALLASLLCGYQMAYAGKIYHSVSVADIDLSGKTKVQAAFLLQKQYDSILQREIAIQSGDKSVKTLVADTGLTLNTQKIVDNCFQVGRDGNFFRQLEKSVLTVFRSNKVHTEAVIDTAKYDTFSKIALGQLSTAPQNASLAVENGVIREIPEQAGWAADTTALTDQLLALASDPTLSIITLEIKPKQADIVVANFVEAKETANNWLARKLVFSYDGKTYSPAAKDIGMWIVFTNTDGKYSASLSDGAIQAYLNGIAKNFEIVKKDRKINASDNSVLEEGVEGKLLDRTAAIKQIRAAMVANASANIAFVTYAVAPTEIKVFPAEGMVAGRFEGKYLDVDLTTQRLCRIDGANIVDCFIISSGKASMPTPTGTFSITGKSPRAFSAKYGLWMPWWEQFNGPYGIHELPETDTWKEVPDHLGTPVSHGCVRLGVGPAQAVYDWTSIGTPVYIHK